MPTKHKKSGSVKKGKSGNRRSHRRRSASKKMVGGAGCGAPKQAGGSVASHEVMSFVNTSGPTVSDYLQMELPSRDSISNLKTQVQMGGSSKKNQPLSGGSSNSKKNQPLSGGSMVSDKVMSAKTGMQDYMSQLPQAGGAGCGANPKKLVGGAGSCGANTKKLVGGAGCNSCGSKSVKQMGGSPASSRLDSFTMVNNRSTMNEQKPAGITADMIGGDMQPNLYELTGGAKGRKKGKSGSMKKVMAQKGGSFWNMAGCGPWNGTDAGRKYADFFTKTSKCPGPEWYANPPELPKAGSGDAADLIVGATYPFA